MQLTRLQELLATQDHAELLEEGKQHDKDFDGIRSIVDDCLADLKDKLGKGGNLATLFKASGASKMDTVKDADGKNVLKQIIDLTTEYTKAVAKLMTEAEILVSQVAEGMDVDGDLLEEAKKEMTPKEKKTIGWYIVDPDGDNAGYRDSVSGKNKAEKDCLDANRGLKTGKSRVVYGYMPDGAGSVKKLPAPVYEDVLTEANSDYEDSSEFTDEFYGMSQDIEKMKSKMKNPRWMKWMKVTDTNFGTECESPARAAITAVGTLSTQFTDIEDELDKAN
jgi:hypothetical protein